MNFLENFSEVTAALMAPGRYPGSSGTRNLHDNLSDLKAQVAASQKVQLMVCKRKGIDNCCIYTISSQTEYYAFLITSKI